MRKEVTGFTGAIRRLEANMLPETAGVIADNVDRRRNDLRAWKAPATVATVPSGRASILRMGRDVADPAQYWLSFTTIVDAIRSFVDSDPTEKTYITGWGTEPRWTDTTLALASAPYPTSYRILGVPAPATAPVLNLNVDGPSTGGAKQDFTVVLTFVTSDNQEGSITAPSNVVQAYPGATFTVNSLPTVPAGNYSINRFRAYISYVGASGTATYLFAAEVSSGATSIAIDTDDLGDALETAEYDMPPADGHSIIALWNDFAAMASGKSVRFCVPLTIYAWPSAYKMTFPDTVVGLATFDQALLVLTTGAPYVVQGQDPSSMSSSPLPLDQACVSKRSIVSFGHGAVWASPDGLYYMSSAGPANLTAQHMARADWQALVPSSIIGVRLEREYLGFYNDGTGLKGFLIDPLRPDLGMVFFSTGYSAAYHDKVLDATFVLSGTNVQQWDAGTAMTYRYRTKRFRWPLFSATWFRLAATSYGQTFRVYLDGVLKHTRTVASGKAYRIPVKQMPQEWQFEIEGTGPVQGLLLADNPFELQA